MTSSLKKAPILDIDQLFQDGMTQLKNKDWSGAISSFETALQGDEDRWDLHYGLGVAYQETGRMQVATLCFQRTLRLNIEHVEANIRIGQCYSALSEGDSALSMYREALRLDPNNSDARFCLGAELNKQGYWNQAIVELQKTIELAPEMACAHSDLGVAFTHGQYFEAALECHRRALELAPNWGDIHNNYGLTLLRQQRLDEAKTVFETAVKLDPTCDSAIMNISTAYLHAGDLAGAWPTLSLHRRNKFKNHLDRFWQGNAIPGKRLLVHATDGLGDTLQMARFLPQLAKFGTHLILEVQDSLTLLLKNCKGFDEIRGLSDHRDDFDFQVSIFELPFILQYTFDTLPETTPYLHANSALVDYWAKRLGSDKGFKIGINWHGNPKVKQGLHRSCRLSDFAPIAEIPGVKLYNLQKGMGKFELNDFNKTFSLTDFGEELDEAHGPFMDTAAIMQNLDLIITVDTSVCHLAGGLGKPTWIALPQRVDWRWLLERSDTPWYPTVQLFRQKNPGDWDKVFSEMAATLKKKLNSAA
jgi:Tfp pilus assembly protein PilF